MEDTFPAGRRTALGLVGSILALAVLAGGCSNYIGTTAASYLRRVREDPDPNLRYIAYSKLAQPNCYDSAQQKSEAVKTLLEKLEQGKEPVASRAVIVHTLGTLRDPAARDVIVRLASDPEPVLRVQACRALGKVGRPEDATVLARVMAVDSLEDCRIAAIDALGDLRADDPRINGILVNGMRHEDPATRLASLKALRKITGKDFGTDATAWQAIVPREGAASPTQVAAGPESKPGPAYPPRPPVPPAIVSADADPDTLRAGLAPAPAAGSAPPPAASPRTYPTRNPNLPAP